MKNQKTDHYILLMIKQILTKIFKSNITKYFFLVIRGLFVDYLVYTLLYYVLNFGVIISNCLSFLVGLLVNVVLLRKYLFCVVRFSLIHDYFLSVVSNGGVYFLGTLMMAFMVHNLFFNHYVAKTIVLGVTFFINFFVRKYFFTKQSEGYAK